MSLTSMLKGMDSLLRGSRLWSRRTLPHGWSLSMPGDGAVYGRAPDGYEFFRHPLSFIPRDSLAADWQLFGEARDRAVMELVRAWRLREVVGWMTRVIERTIRGKR